MNSEFINKVSILLSNQKIDDRAKPLIKLYFLGKLKSGDLTLDKLEAQNIMINDKIIIKKI